MAAGGMSVKGGPETAAAFDKLGDDVRDMTGTHDRIVRARLSGIASLTPSRSGALRASWEASAGPGAGSILSDREYAWPVESGVESRGILGAAMIARTLEAETDAIVGEYQAAVLDAARRRGFRLG